MYFAKTEDGNILAAQMKCKNDGYAYVKVYFPKGRWTDFFTGRIYDGGCTRLLQVSLDRIPVFAKEGAIIPMIKERTGNSANFDEIELKVVPGVNKYRMFDEGGYTDFSLEKTEGGYTLKIDDEYEYIDFETALKEMDIIMLLRVQHERHESEMQISKAEYH